MVIPMQMEMETKIKIIPIPHSLKTLEVRDRTNSLYRRYQYKEAHLCNPHASLSDNPQVNLRLKVDLTMKK